MPLNEADTRAKLIDPAIHARGWTENFIRREETAGTNEIVAGIGRKQANGRVDYTLRIKSDAGPQPVAVALIEAKAEQYPATHGLQQGKLYAATKRLNVPFVYSTNGHEFVEYDNFTGLTHAPRPMSDFPTPEELKQRYESGKGFSLDGVGAKPLVTAYAKGESGRRYYQDAAIRAVLEKIAKGENRALLSLATGSGKTFIAVNLLKRISDAGQLRRALFVCDRDELRTQALAAFQNEFGNDAAAASRNNPQKNARVVVATYQTLGVDHDDSDASFLKKNYPENYFSHIVIDECHRSAWGKWSEVLTRNTDAVQIGLTATPREFDYTEDSPASRDDEQVSADNYRYFGEPAYEYSMGQGIEDGWLAAMEIIRNDIFLDQQAEDERRTGVIQEDLEGKDIRDAVTGAPMMIGETRSRYEASGFEARLMIPERVKEMCANLFDYLVSTGHPEQKTIIFCARDRHADDVANEMNNLYADWCTATGNQRVQDYAFKCTAESGSDYLADLKSATRHHFIATTVDLLTTGVDVPPVCNIVFFRYVSSPIAFHQMVGRGTRLHPPTNKLMFRVYDYTNATRLFGEDFRTKFTKQEGKPADMVGVVDRELESFVRVEGFDVRISNAGTYIMTTND
jgi:type I restriction enzyme R subunit